jgi:alpha-L-rhamnosidase
MKNTIKRTITPIAYMPLDSNIRRLYNIEEAAWVWHPDFAADQEGVLCFENTIDLKKKTRFKFHVSADQRYELYLNDEFIDMGPDRGDIQHWSFSTYQADLQPGKHHFKVLAYWIGEATPTAQQTLRGGFIFKAEGSLSDQLDTGTDHWRCRPIEGWSFDKQQFGSHDAIGRCHTIRLDKETLKKQSAKKPEVVAGPVSKTTPWGCMRKSWGLYPTNLPAQTWDIWNKGKVVAAIESKIENEVFIEKQYCESSRIPDWQSFLDGKASIKIKAGQTLSALIDLEDYVCGFPKLELAGSGEVSVRWAESLYEPRDGKRSNFKGNRSEVAEKIFAGIGDRVEIDATKRQTFRPAWWRAGRYVLITATADKKALTLHNLTFRESRYPLENQAKISTGNKQLDALTPMFVRGMQMCSHETYMDCPHYEQLMYVGDTRLEMLTTYVMTRDDCLPRRGIELFDFSRHYWGMIAEHYPSRSPQMSPTFSCIWTSIVKDYALWRGDPDWVRERMVGVRSSLEVIDKLIAPSGILERVPGWPYCDWVVSWDTGYPPGSKQGKPASLINLFYIQALFDAAMLEDYMQQPLRAKQYRQMAKALSARVVETFWNEERGMLADDIDHKYYGEQAQCLALLNDVLPAAKRKRCLKGLLEAPDLARASIYFSYYLFETLYRFGLGDEMLKRMDTWQTLADNGLCTPIESPEPSRSDCHAWGSHPLHHYHASFCGIRPGEFGFQSIDISPCPGTLKNLSAKTPHPKGWITANLRFEDGKCRADITLPKDTSGRLNWNGTSTQLKSGENQGIIIQEK